MKCLCKYDWVKLCRMHLPLGNGIMGQWARLASKAAFRKGKAFYCGYHNEVMPGTWVGGIVGLKSILNAKSRAEALGIMDKLVALGYICYELDEKSKKLTYCIKDWVIECSGKECMLCLVTALASPKRVISSLSIRCCNTPCSSASVIPNSVAATFTTYGTSASLM